MGRGGIEGRKDGWIKGDKCNEKDREMGWKGQYRLRSVVYGKDEGKG